MIGVGGAPSGAFSSKEMWKTRCIGIVLGSASLKLTSPTTLLILNSPSFL